MDRKLTIYFTSDIHGYFAPTDYANNCRAASGLANCAANFTHDRNTLILDGGDTLQGSPFTYWLYSRTEEKSLIPAKLMTLAGYDYITLGNHDFNYGVKELERYLGALEDLECENPAMGFGCLCANVEGLRHNARYAISYMGNGLRVGICGVTSQFIPNWEKPENIEGVTFTDAFETARDVLAELKKEKVDITICLYHGGFENDVDTGKPLSQTRENEGWRICQELDYDILLTGHQHMPFADKCVNGTWTCQPPDKARQYIRMDVTVSDTGKVTARSELCPAGDVTPEAFQELLDPLEAETAKFLDTPLGHLDTALRPSEPLDRALNGSLIANFFNQVQLEASGADISCTCLANTLRGFDENVTVRDIVASYVFPNTLKTIRVDRAVLTKALERSADYFAFDEHGEIKVSDSFLKPIVAHFNFDFISGIEATIDLRKAPGERVSSILYKGEELSPDRTLTMCLNNYRASGAGGYEFYADCETVREQTEEISELIINYVDRHRDIVVDKTRWLTIIK
ncbi:MAG: bifunctional metallophosphatase/5'-nucleotidase [Oscillospiraceae bacterium]|nr:bifunctional metallophosphatase/5'-nucleotidase [Oscillospiraceae bacterium]